MGCSPPVVVLRILIGAGSAMHQGSCLCFSAASTLQLAWSTLTGMRSCDVADVSG
jgi:hypothetical protein